jgi:ketosteroid isomerase-like protein
MKKIMITLAFSTLSLIGFAQKNFTAETWKELLDEYKNDSKAFFANRISDDFRYPLTNGKYLGRNDVIGWDKENILNTEMKDPVIFQSGDLAVVTGRHVTEHGVEKSNASRTDNFGATYTWQRQNGKWMFVASQHLTIAPSTFDEATFNQMVARWGNDPAGFVQNDCDKKFIFTDGNGKSYNYDQAVETYKNAFSKIDKKVENLKVWQSGNTGLATGKTIETYQFKDGKAFTYIGMFTYTFSQQNGKWVLASAQHTDYKAPKTADK